MTVTTASPQITPVITASGPTTFCAGGSVTLSVNGDAMQFDGIDDYVETSANITDLTFANFTIEAWIKTTTAGCGIVNCANDDQIWDAGEKVFYLDLSGQPAFVGWGNGYILSSLAVNDGNWHHVAVVWDYSNGSGKIQRVHCSDSDSYTPSRHLCEQFYLPLCRRFSQVNCIWWK